MKTSPEQVADVVIVRGDKVLLVQQRKAIAHGLWSFPGGHVEDDETIMQAIMREVHEELGVTLLNPVFLKTYAITTPRGPLDINTFTGELSGDIRLKEDELLAYQWFTRKELHDQKDVLRNVVVIEQAQDAFNQTSRHLS